MDFGCSVFRYSLYFVLNLFFVFREETLYELLGLVDESVVNQWIAKNGWKVTETGYVLIGNQEENIKNKKITEKIDLESVAGIIASCI